MSVRQNDKVFWGSYVEGGSLESFSRLKTGIGLLDLFDFSLHEGVVSGGGALFLGGSYIRMGGKRRGKRVECSAVRKTGIEVKK